MTPEQAGLQKIAYRVREALNILPCGKTKLYQLIKDGRLKKRKLGRSTVLLASDFVTLLEEIKDEPDVP